MKRNSITKLLEITELARETSNLTVVKKDKKTNAKLLTLKKSGDKTIIILPPQPEMYIKAKKHDFL